MAQKGRKYLLAFRRDFCMQEFYNSFAYAQRYDIFPADTIGIIGNAVDSVAQRVICQGVNSNNQLQFDSVPQTIGVFTFFFRLLIQIQNDPQWNYSYVECNDIHVGNIFRNAAWRQLISHRFEVDCFGATTASTPGVFESLHPTSTLFRSFAVVY